MRLNEWVAAVGAELGIDPAEANTRLVLDLARDVAHNVLRPGAPATAYLLGVAVGRGADPTEAAARLSALALSWTDAAQDAGQDAGGDGQDARQIER